MKFLVFFILFGQLVFQGSGFKKIDYVEESLEYDEQRVDEVHQGGKQNHEDSDELNQCAGLLVDVFPPGVGDEASDGEEE